MMQGDRHLRKIPGSRAKVPAAEAPPFDPAGWAILAYFSIFCIMYALTPNIIGALTLGWYLSLIIDVPARLLDRIRIVPFGLAVTVSALFVFALLILGIGTIIPIILEEGRRLFPVLRESFLSLSLPDILRDNPLSEELMSALQSAGTNLMQKTAEIGVGLVNSLLQRVPDISTALIVFVITAAYFAALLPVFKKNLWRFFPASGADRARRFLSEVYTDIRHFIAGQMIVALFVGVAIWLGMLLAGIPYAMFIGFLSGLTNFIPYMGIVVAAIPSLILGLGHGGIVGVLKVALVLFAVNQFEGWFLSPRIQGSRMKLNWFAIILAILVSGAIFGLMGILIAIPLVVFFKRFWVFYIQEAFSRL